MTTMYGIATGSGGAFITAPANTVGQNQIVPHYHTTLASTQAEVGCMVNKPFGGATATYDTDIGSGTNYVVRATKTSDGTHAYLTSDGAGSGVWGSSSTAAVQYVVNSTAQNIANVLTAVPTSPALVTFTPAGG